MAKTEALSIFKANGTDEDELAESYTSITDQIQKAAISMQLKSQESQITGDPHTGSVVVRRLKTSTVKDYKTARTAGEGDNIKNNGVTVNLNVRKEIVEEVNKFDLDQYGLPGMIARRATNFALSFAAFMDRAFFTAAETAGTEVDVSDGSDTYDQVELLIQEAENTQNDNVDGVDRSLLRLTLNTATYGKLKKFMQNQPNPTEQGGTIETFNGVRVFSNTRQTKSAICMVVGSVAQPVAIIDFKQEDIPLSAEVALEMFFNYGVQAVMADLIFWADMDEISA